MFFDEFQKRKQIRKFDQDNTPKLSLIQDALTQAHLTVASKQNLMPYKIYVIANNPDINSTLYDMSHGTSGTIIANTNLLSAPYQFIYTARLATPTGKVLEDIQDWNHVQPPCNPDMYKNSINSQGACIEIGMHATVLTKILLDSNIGVAYTRCFDFHDREQRLPFVSDDIYLLMSAGYYSDEDYHESNEDRPDFETIHEMM